MRRPITIRADLVVVLRMEHCYGLIPGLVNEPVAELASAILRENQEELDALGREQWVVMKNLDLFFAPGRRRVYLADRVLGPLRNLDCVAALIERQD
ncbi:MAG TPA: hypothetical protein VGV89_01550 [Thermoplasmata archaeon]|nr:hypothetical protein [Thermoplasmata archaeon]